MNSSHKRFFVRATFFSLPIILIWSALEYRLAEINTPSMKRLETIKQVGPNAQALIIGSSHAVLGFDTQSLPFISLTLADFSQSLVIGSQLVERYLPEMPKLEYLIVDISAFSLEYNLWNSPESWRNFYYSHYLGIAGDGGLLQKLDLRNYSLFFLDGPPNVVSWILHGFPESIGTDADLMARYMKSASSETNRAQLHLSLMNASNRPRNVKAIKAMIQTALAHRVKVVLVTLPITKQYLSSFNPDKMKAMKETVESIVQEFKDRPVSYHDYQNDNRFGKDDFADSDHLNKEGARKIAQILPLELLSASQKNR